MKRIILALVAVTLGAASCGIHPSYMLWSAGQYGTPGCTVTTNHWTYDNGVAVEEHGDAARAEADFSGCVNGAVQLDYHSSLHGTGTVYSDVVQGDLSASTSYFAGPGETVTAIESYIAVGWYNDGVYTVTKCAYHAPNGQVEDDCPLGIDP